MHRACSSDTEVARQWQLLRGHRSIPAGARKIEPAQVRKGLQPCIANEREPLAMESLDNVPDDAEPGGR